jgi:antitoxin component YwqK of YwqJK toxin-antitoxin module
LKRASFFVFPILALAVAGMAAGEDRTERIADANGARELVYRGDILAEDRSFDARGAILEERIFDSSSLPKETRTYIREGGRIEKVEATDASGSPSGSMTYRYDRNGRLLGVSSEGSFGAGSAGMIASHGAPQGAWVSRPGGGQGSAAKANADVTTTVLEYDDSGRVSIVQTMHDGEAVSVEKRIYGEGGILASVRIEDTISGISSESLYDANGRISTRTDTPAKGPQVKSEYRYDDSGRLVEELSFRGRHRSSRIIEYAEDGSIAREETSKDGEKLLSVSYIANGRTEELYENGSVFVKATYIGNRKVKDEFYIDGVTIRTRDY